MGKQTTENNFELENILEKKYGDRFQPDFLSSLMGTVSGSLDNNKFCINYKSKESLIISSSTEGKEVLEELLPTLTDVMGDYPICGYDLQKPGQDERESNPTMEWSLNNPDERIKDIIDGKAYNDGSVIQNLVLFNGKEISDYYGNELPSTSYDYDNEPQKKIFR